MKPPLVPGPAFVLRGRIDPPPNKTPRRHFADTRYLNLAPLALTDDSLNSHLTHLFFVDLIRFFESRRIMPNVYVKLKVRGSRRKYSVSKVGNFSADNTPAYAVAFS